MLLEVLVGERPGPGKPLRACVGSEHPHRLGGGEDGRAEQRLLGEREELAGLDVDAHRLQVVARGLDAAERDLADRRPPPVGVVLGEFAARLGHERDPDAQPPPVEVGEGASDLGLVATR